MIDRARSATVRTVALVAVAVALLTTGPLLRIRSWWSYDDPLTADPVVVGVRAAIGLAAVAVLVHDQRWRRLAPPLLLAWVVALAVLVVSTLWSVRPGVTARESLLVAAALAAGAAIGVVDPVAARWGAWVGLHLGLGWSAIACVLVQPRTQDELGAWVGVYVNRNSLALVSALGVLASVVLLVAALRRDGRWVRPDGAPLLLAGLLVAAVLADLVLLARSRSRTPLVALAAAGVVAIVVVGAHRWARDHGRPRRVAGIVAVAGVVMTLGAWLGRDALTEAAGRDASLSGRSALWEMVVDWIGRRPVFGHGYLGADATVEFQYDAYLAQGMVLDSAHSTWLDVVLGTGIVGGLVVGVALGALGWVVLTRAIEHGGVAVAWAALLAFLLVEHSVETLLVGGQIAAAALGYVVAGAGGSSGASSAVPSSPVAATSAS